MPRSKKEATSVDAVKSSVKPSKKKARVGVAVRVVSEKPKAVEQAPQIVKPVAAEPIAAPVEQPKPIESPRLTASPVVPLTPKVEEVAKEPVAQKTNRPYSDKEKSMILWTAVIFIMIMVFGLWFMTIKLQLSNEVTDKPMGEFDFKKVSEDISQAMQEVNASLKQLSTTTPTSTSEMIATTTTNIIATTTTGELISTSTLDEASIQRTIKELEAQLNRSATTTEAATSSVR